MPIWRPVETATLHTDSSDFAWGAVLNGKNPSRGYWTASDAAQRETISTARRGALPAASALRIAEFTFDLAANWGVLALAKPQLDDNDRKTLRTLRNGLGFTSGYMTGSRPSSIVFLDQTVGVSASDDHGVVVNRDFVKGTTDEPDDARGKISLRR